MDYLEISELYHYGILGQKWGVRRYQNEDGSLTEEGKAKYGTKENYEIKKKEKAKMIGGIAGGLLGLKIIAKELNKGTGDFIDSLFAIPILAAMPGVVALGTIAGQTIGSISENITKKGKNAIDNMKNK